VLPDRYGEVTSAPAPSLRAGRGRVGHV